MTFEIIIIIGLVGIIIILARKLPAVLRSQKKVEAAEENRASYGVKFEPKVVIPVKKDSSVLLFEADRLFAQGKHIEAEKVYIQAAREESNNPKIYNRLGAIYLERKNYSDAKEAFKETLKLGSDVASRHFNYGISCFELGENKEALKAVKRALELDKDNKKYAEFLLKVSKKVA